MQKLTALVAPLALIVGQVAVSAQKPAQKPKACGSRVELANIWGFLAKTYDKDGDGKITKKEFTRGAKQFRNHDRNRDGVIDVADYPAGKFWNGFGPGIARRADGDRDGIVTKKEWKAFVRGIDANGDGILTGKEFGKVWGPRIADKQSLIALSFDQNGNGKIEVSDFESLFADLDRGDDGQLDKVDLQGNVFLGERSRRRALKARQMAPDFELPVCDDEKKATAETVKLSSFRGKRPVALIFGSYT